MPKVDSKVLQPAHYVRKKGKKRDYSRVKDQYDAIEVKFIDGPSTERLNRNFGICASNFTRDEAKFDFTEEEEITARDNVLNYRALPHIMEHFRISLYMGGLDMIDSTHLIRHRGFSIAAQCHGDRDTRDDYMLVKPGILDSEFADEFVDAANACMKLYQKMTDSDVIDVFDARTIMPRCFSHFYFVSGNIKDWIAYIKTRLSYQVQPCSDALLALSAWVAIVEEYPFLKDQVDIYEPDRSYERICKAGMTHVHQPVNDQYDTFDWTEDQFYATKPRQEYLGWVKFRLKWVELALKLKGL